MLATNELLQRIFSKNTIDDNTLFAPGNVIIINASKGAVGDQVSFLIMAGWLFKIWYYALARAQLNMERIPVIIAIDEFQNIADLSLIDTVLAEARKYGMHLLLAHQHTGQIDMNLLKSLMSNTV
jgi:type IV secretory pathway TraG/TraD family ATPase VirD4